MLKPLGPEHEYSKHVWPSGVVGNVLDSQMLLNKHSSDLMDCVRYGNIGTGRSIFIEDPRTKWQTFRGKITSFKYWITGLRIAHKDDICNCEDDY